MCHEERSEMIDAHSHLVSILGEGALWQPAEARIVDEHIHAAGVLSQQIGDTLAYRLE